MNNTAVSNTTPSPTPTESVSVLIVDDNVLGAQTLNMLLELEGYHVSVATTGKDALTLFQSIKPSIVLLDIGLPDMDGYSVAREMRRTQMTPHPFIVAITGWGGEQDIERSKLAGCDTHLTKPVNFDQLNEVIAQHAIPMTAQGKQFTVTNAD